MNSREVRVVVTAAHEGGRGYNEGGTVGWGGGSQVLVLYLDYLQAMWVFVLQQFVKLEYAFCTNT